MFFERLPWVYLQLESSFGEWIKVNGGFPTKKKGTAVLLAAETDNR
jgi:hypothetical protein